MKKFLFVLLFGVLSFITSAQVSKAFNVVTPGSLLSLLSTDANIVTDLTITGQIDARDFKALRDNMSRLHVLDLSGVSIMDYTGTEGTIPIAYTSSSTLYPANTIPAQAFYYFSTGAGKTSLTSITLPTNLTSIGSGAFEGCSNLTAIQLPTTVTSIGVDAFNSCDSLATINLQFPLSFIGEGAFYNCIGLKTISIPIGISSINRYTFYGCSGLTSISIPSTVSLIGDNAFHGCSGLSSISIPNNVTSIESDTYNGCSGLTSITIPPNVTFIGNYAFNSCTKLTSIDIPSSVNFIDVAAFGGCIGLTSISIPSSVTSIGDYAFFGCSSLTSISVNKSIPIILPSANVFNGIIKNNCILTVPLGAKSVYKLANYWKDFANIVEMGNTAIPTITNASINLYPNPITDYFFATGLLKGSIVSILDISGKLLITKQLKNNEKISISSFPKGIYSVIFSSTEGVVVKKIIKL